MSTQHKNKNLIGMVGVKSTNFDTDLKGREKIVFKLGPANSGPDEGKNTVAALIEYLQPFADANSTVKLDFRISEKESRNGRKFKSSFLMVSKLSDEEVTTTPKKAEYVSKTEETKSQVDRVNASV